MIKKSLTILLFLLIVAFGFFQKDALLRLINEGGPISIFISILFVAICVFFPIVPFPILGGTIGAVFGITDGVFISLTGAMAGTMVFFFICRYGFREYAQTKLMKYPKVKEYEQFLSRNSFIAILSCRLIPVIPALVLNTICALSNVRWLSFFIASAIGKIPNILLLSYAGSVFASNKLYSIGLYGAYLLIVFLINFVIIYRRTAKNE